MREHPITEILGDTSLEPLDDLGTARLVRANHFPEILRIELTGELRGLDEIAERRTRSTPGC